MSTDKYYDEIYARNPDWGKPGWGEYAAYRSEWYHEPREADLVGHFRTFEKAKEAALNNNGLTPFVGHRESRRWWKKPDGQDWVEIDPKTLNPLAADGDTCICGPTCMDKHECRYRL